MSKSKKLALAFVVGIPLVCGVAGGLLAMVGSAHADASAKSEREAALKLGMPLDFSQISPAPVSASENAAPMYRTLGKLLKEKRYAAALKTITDAQAKQATSADVLLGRNALPTVEPILNLATQLDQRTGCNFERDWSKGPNLLLPEYADMKALVKLLAFKADAQEARGYSSGALKSLAYANRVALDAGSDPILISMLVQIACQAVCNREYERLIERHSHDTAFLTQVEAQIKQYDTLPSMKKALCGEIAFERLGLKLLRSTRDLTVLNDGDQQNPVPPAPFETTLIQSGLVQNTLDAKIISAWTIAWSKFPQDNDDWQGYESALKAMTDAVENDNSPGSEINKILMPVFSQSGEAVGNLQAHDRMLLTSIELLKQRNAKGELPVVLPKSLGTERVDPFDGDLLRYRKEGAGFVLYSIGQDRKDDGGVERQPNVPQNEGFDEVMHFH